MHHLNRSEKCTGTYTYGRPEGPKKSANDHILVNDTMLDSFRGMHINENEEELNISDHNLLRAWFNIGRGETTSWKKKKYEKGV